jgi:uncharacterized protein with PIN domain/sulfur carrier protein ThiS
MKYVTVRIYGPLNGFLPVNRRQVGWSFALGTPTSVKDLVEGLGVPHPEIDLILVNGESVSFDYAVQEADRIAVFPRFKTLDISGVARVRPQPFDALRFILDGHLGKLARYLRLVGIDATCPVDASDRTLADLALREQRILLTRDQALLKRRIVTHGYFVRESDANRQLKEILRHFGPLTLAPFTRCVRCNALLRDVAKSAVDHIPEVSCPVLVIAGERDRIVPPEQSRRLYDAVRSAKTFLLLPGVDHNDDDLLAGREMVRAIVQFLQQIG